MKIIYHFLASPLSNVKYKQKEKEKNVLIIWLPVKSGEHFIDYTCLRVLWHSQTNEKIVSREIIFNYLIEKDQCRYECFPRNYQGGRKTAKKKKLCWDRDIFRVKS